MSKIANYVQADNGLGLAICEEIDEEWLSDYEYKQRFGVSRDGTVNFLFTDQGSDRIWGAMTREQQIAVLEWCELSELIEELVKPESAQEASVRQAIEANPKSIMTDSSLSAFKIELRDSHSVFMGVILPSFPIADLLAYQELPIMGYA